MPMGIMKDKAAPGRRDNRNVPPNIMPASTIPMTI